MGLVAAVLWGSQYPIAKSAYGSIDPFTLTAVRYAIASVGFGLILATLEGTGALRYEGRFRRLALLGSVGLIGGVLGPFVGLAYTTTQSAALVGALQPLMAAVVIARRSGRPTDRRTGITIAVALIGVALVITKGHPAAIVDGEIGWGVVLVALGQLGWIAYTIGGAAFGDWSTIRFTALSIAPGTLAVFACLALATLAGWATPSATTLGGEGWTLAYLAIGPGIGAVLLWNLGRARIGPGAIAVFQNAVPVTAFAIVIGQGYRPNAAEIAGATLTIGALAWFTRSGPAEPTARGRS
jgi:drug/metabolite transporter (DMT)-like permease